MYDPRIFYIFAPENKRHNEDTSILTRTLLQVLCWSTKTNKYFNKISANVMSAEFKVVLVFVYRDTDSTCRKTIVELWKNRPLLYFSKTELKSRYSSQNNKVQLLPSRTHCCTNQMHCENLPISETIEFQSLTSGCCRNPFILCCTS